MNILVIGNGFDLAHGLPTKYIDFLEFCNLIEYMYQNKITTKEDIKIYHDALSKKVYINVYHNLVEHCVSNGLKELFERVIDNIWIEYFQQCDMHGKENWIDFEEEIANMVKIIESSMSGCGQYDFLNPIQNSFFSEKFTCCSIEYMLADSNEKNKIEKNQITYKELLNKLLNDLNRMIRAFEIYVSQCIQLKNFPKLSKDIKDLKVDKVLTFNYTDNYEKIYGNGAEIEYDYIHGKADINNTVETNNMVLGIDEYLPDDRKNKDVEFIAFKKFYQRIHKETGCKYKEWVDEIKKDYFEYMRGQKEADSRFITYPADSREDIANSVEAALIKNEKFRFHNLIIFGHSLDVTDGDILRDLILNDNVYTTIYYFDKDKMGQQIANLVKVIGQDELIRRTGGSTKTIEFKQQQDMVERK